MKIQNLIAISWKINKNIIAKNIKIQNKIKTIKNDS